MVEFPERDAPLDAHQHVAEAAQIEQAGGRIGARGAQQYVIGLVLAQARLAARLGGETPIILLDEIAAHLDQIRREALYGVLAEIGAQTFMTGTDASAFAALGDRAEFLAVEDGKVRPAA